MKYLIALGALFAVPQLALAATLSLSPASGTYEVGDTVTVSVYASSPQEALNAVSGVIAVPTDLFNIVSASASGSVVNFWVQQPTVSGSSVSFEGVVLNPGFTGSAGKVATLTLYAKKAGTASLTFSTAAILANDGQGTNILSGRTGATYTVHTAAPTAPAAPAPTESEEPESATAEASAFRIYSDTHPREDTWYNTTKGTFYWEVPSGATATRMVLTSSPTGQPSVLYTPAAAEKTIDSLPEGVTYLRVQHRVNGEWGGIGTYRIQIDTTPPEPFEISFPHGVSSVNPQPIIYFNTDDELSGIGRYDVKVGEGGVLATAAPTDSNPYTLPPQEPGAHIVSVTAMDAAGNARTMTESFYIEGIDMPQFTTYDEEIHYGDLLKVRGITYPNSAVEVYVYRNEELVTTEYTRSNSLGDFATVVAKRLAPGVYELTARVIDARGARSLETEPIVVEVKGNPVINTLIFFGEHWIAALLLLGVIGLLMALNIIGWRHVGDVLGRMHATTVQGSDAHRALELLRKDLASHTRKLKRASKTRDLSLEEITFLEQFAKDLADTETLVDKEVKRSRRKVVE